jgi:hypothetical protein
MKKEAGFAKAAIGADGGKVGAKHQFFFVFGLSTQMSFATGGCDYIGLIQ